MAASTRAFVLRHTRLRPVPGLGEIRLHLADDVLPLWRALQVETGDPDTPLPFWAFAWGGGLAIGRYLRDHPETVAGRRVFDLGSGSGLCAIAALVAGATEAIGADIDPFSAAAIALNAKANGRRVAIVRRDVLDEEPRTSTSSSPATAGTRRASPPASGHGCAWLAIAGSMSWSAIPAGGTCPPTTWSSSPPTRSGRRPNSRTSSTRRAASTPCERLGQPLRDRERSGERQPGRRVVPGDPGLGPEPGPLALREGDVPGRVAGDRVLAAELAVQDGPRLRVADRRERGEARVEPIPESGRLLDEARVELAVGTCRDEPGVLPGFDREADPGDGTRVAARGRQRTVAAQLGDLEGAGDAPRIAQIRRCGERRGERGQPCGRRREPEGRQLGLDPRPRRQVARECVGVEASGDGAQVQPGASDEDREGPATGDPFERPVRVPDEVGDAERFVGFDQIEPVVRDARSIGGVDLGRTDVEAAEDLPRVGRDDLRRSALRR